MDWANDTTGPVLAKTVEARTIAAGLRYRRGDVSQDQLPGPDASRRQRSDPALCARATRGGAHRRRVRDLRGRWSQSARTLSGQVQRADHRFSRSQARPATSRSAGRRTGKAKRALYLSSPIGLGHGRRDIAVTRELRKMHPDLQVDWLAQDPVTRLLEANGETIHPLSAVSPASPGTSSWNPASTICTPSRRFARMDEVLIANFMIFQDAVEERQLRPRDRRRSLGHRSLLA